jgi:hypothetical protein
LVFASLFTLPNSIVAAMASNSAWLMAMRIMARTRRLFGVH